MSDVKVLLFNGESKADNSDRLEEFEAKVTERINLVYTQKAEDLNNKFRKPPSKIPFTLLFTHYSKWREFDRDIRMWTDKSLDKVYIILFSGGGLNNEVCTNINDAAASIGFEDHVYFLQSSFPSSVDCSALNELVEVFFDFFHPSRKDKRLGSRTDLHNRLQNLIDLADRTQGHSPHLTALSLLCQGALVRHALDEKGSLGETAENALEKMGWDDLDTDTKQSLDSHNGAGPSAEWWRQSWKKGNRINDLEDIAEEEWFGQDKANSAAEDWKKVRALIRCLADGSVPNEEQISKAYLALHDRL